MLQIHYVRAVRLPSVRTARLCTRVGRQVALWSPRVLDHPGTGPFPPGGLGAAELHRMLQGSSSMTNNVELDSKLQLQTAILPQRHDAKLQIQNSVATAAKRDATDSRCP